MLWNEYKTALKNASADYLRDIQMIDSSNGSEEFKRNARRVVEDRYESARTAARSELDATPVENRGPRDDDGCAHYPC